MPARPAVLLFDVNETLLDIEALTPLFARVFGDGRVMREWYAQIVLYSQTLTFAGHYTPFGEIGAGVMRMLATIHGRTIAEADIEELSATTKSLPPHVGAERALIRLRDAGFRLASLTNSAPVPSPTPLEKAGLAPILERMISVDPVGKFKPAPETYRGAIAALGVTPSEVCMVATHVWDLLGAQAVGCRAALVTWPGNAPLPIAGIPQPDVVAPTLEDLAEAIIRHWP